MHIKIVWLVCDRNKHKFTIFTTVGLGLVNGHLEGKFEGYKNVEQTHAKSWRKQVYISHLSSAVKGNPGSGIRKNFA